MTLEADPMISSPASDLPAEICLEVIRHASLDTDPFPKNAYRDIAALERTCKHWHQVIQCHSKAIWQNLYQKRWKQPPPSSPPPLFKVPTDQRPLTTCLTEAWNCWQGLPSSLEKIQIPSPDPAQAQHDVKIQYAKAHYASRLIQECKTAQAQLQTQAQQDWAEVRRASHLFVNELLALAHRGIQSIVMGLTVVGVGLTCTVVGPVLTVWGASCIPLSVAAVVIGPCWMLDLRGRKVACHHTLVGMGLTCTVVGPLFVLCGASCISLSIAAAVIGPCWMLALRGGKMACHHTLELSRYFKAYVDMYHTAWHMYRLKQGLWHLLT